MERIEELFPAYTGRDKELVAAAYGIASKALEGMTRGNGAPFIEHAENVAKIAADEIGLGPECVAAVFLHEAENGIHRDYNDYRDRVGRFSEKE